MEKDLNLNKLLEDVDKIVKEAGEIAKKGKREKIREKHLAGPVSKTDIEIEKFLYNSLTSLLPHSGFYGEEGGKEKEEKLMWVVDPIDGTMNYIHNIPHFSISVALKNNGKILLGEVYDPMKDEMFKAYSGGGAYLNNLPIKVSSCPSFEGAIFSTGFSRIPELREKNLKIFQTFLSKVGSIRRLGSAALDLAYVACGRIDCFFEIGLNSWDISAGVLIVEEAGGKVTDLKGKSQFEEKKEILASNPLLNSMIVEILKKVLPRI